MILLCRSLWCMLQDENNVIKRMKINTCCAAGHTSHPHIVFKRNLIVILEFSGNIWALMCWGRNNECNCRWNVWSDTCYAGGKNEDPHKLSKVSFQKQHIYQVYLARYLKPFCGNYRHNLNQIVMRFMKWLMLSFKRCVSGKEAKMNCKSNSKAQMKIPLRLVIIVINIDIMTVDC